MAGSNLRMACAGALDTLTLGGSSTPRTEERSRMLEPGEYGCCVCCVCMCCVCAVCVCAVCAQLCACGNAPHGGTVVGHLLPAPTPLLLSKTKTLGETSSKWYYDGTHRSSPASLPATTSAEFFDQAPATCKTATLYKTHTLHCHLPPAATDNYKPHTLQWLMC